MNFRQLKEKLNDEQQTLLMYLPIPRTSGISMSYFINESDSIFTYRNYELESCFYQSAKTIPPKPKTSENKDDWDLIHFVANDQSFFINKLSEIQTNFCKSITIDESKKIFSIVRNPVDRLFSIWNYCTNSSYEYQLFSLEEDDYKIKDFNQFVKEFATNGLPKKYPSQMFLKMSEILDVDLGDNLLIFKFEELDSCIDYLKSNYNITEEYKHYNSSERSTEKNITKKTLNLIYNLYKEDFDRFGYKI